jgi:hypothetical protein
VTSLQWFHLWQRLDVEARRRAASELVVLARCEVNPSFPVDFINDSIETARYHGRIAMRAYERSSAAWQRHCDEKAGAA